MMPEGVRCGDVVFHRPSRETWVVAYAEGRDLSPAGWPACIARLDDCLLVDKASDEQHRADVAMWLHSHGDDFRKRAVTRLYGELVDPRRRA